jgi:hypothetical protein
MDPGALKKRMLPKLLYFGDVPVESSYHGSALLYRLLEDYPHDRLTILECARMASLPERRLARVSYQHLPPAHLVSRLQYSRVHRWAGMFSILTQGRLAHQTKSRLGGFHPDAILTVAHEYAWLAAARFAREHQLPLHLIVHDDWPTFTPLPEVVRPWAAKKFASVYRQAASRLCVSPYMEERYRRTCGVPGRVLLPCRAKNSTWYQQPPGRLGQRGGSLTGLFGGSLTSPSYIRTLGVLARALQPNGGRVLIYGPTSEAQAAAVGVHEPNLEWRGLVPHEELIQTARQEADFLFVPMSFEPFDLKTMEVNFPSKLADYTAMGLPLLIAGPPSTSAVRWASDNSGVAEVIEDDTLESMTRAVTRLADPDHRRNLAAAAIEAGARQFSHQAATMVFLDEITAASQR